jgi:pilus assembly protein CpaB
MKRSRILVLVIALAAGAVAAYLASGNRPVAQQQPDATEVLVAKAGLSVTQVIGDKDIEWQTRLTEGLFSKAIKKSERPDALHQFVGAVVRLPVAAGEPIREAAAVILTQGMRAVPVEIQPGNGMIRPDENVDVMLNSQKKGGERLTSELILENARVLAVGKDAMIEVTPEQADKLAQSGGRGTLELVAHGERPPFITLVRFGQSISVSNRNR